MKYVSVKRLYDELDYWIHIGIGDDIINIPRQRQEYSHLVKKYRHLPIEPKEKAKLVLIELEMELKKPWFMQPTFWHLFWLNIYSKFQ